MFIYRDVIIREEVKRKFFNEGKLQLINEEKNK